MVFPWSPTSAQESQQAEEEIVSNLAAGRVVIVVAKDGIVLATLENPIEPNTLPPLIVPLGSRSAGVLLGAIDWVALNPGTHFARLDRELPKLHGPTTAAGPRLQKEASGGVAGDIEDVGLGLFERLREVAKQIHAKMDLPPQEPLVELVLADYIEGYGPEVWLVSYSLEQLPVHADFWETRVLRPRYTQLWPPEKGQPRTLMEISYPPNAAPPLLELLRQDDPRLRRARVADSSTTALAQLLSSGDTRKAQAADTTNFVRANLDAIGAPGAAQIVAVINEQTGFDWILAPVEKTKAPEDKTRPPGAPTLRKPTP